MTVLPQLEQELLGAHARRTRRGRVPDAVSRLALAGAVGLAIAVAAVVLLARHAPRPVTAGPRAARVLLRDLHNATAYAAGGSLYVGLAGGVLEQINPTSGSVVARATLRGQVDQLLLAAGSLWVTSTDRGTLLLTRLAPGSLAHAPATSIGAKHRRSSGLLGSLALAGGWLWVGNGSELVRVSTVSGAVSLRVPVAGARSLSVWADPTGFS